MPNGGVLLKVCGVTNLEDIDACIERRVDAVGLNLWPGSKRALTVAEAEPLAERCRAANFRPQVVGVVVDPEPDEVIAMARRLGLDAIQPHGDAPPQRYASLGIPWVWVVRGTPDLDTLVVPSPAPAWVLLDAHVPGFGGRGVTTDWEWAARAVSRLAPLSVWLAGGIVPENAAQAIAQVGPVGLDVASGVETATDPRRKDATKIAALAAICHNVSAR